MRAVGKRLGEGLLLRVAAWPARRAGDALILAYHNIVPDRTPPCGDASLHMPVSSFRSHLDTLARYCEVVRLDDLLSLSPDPHRPRVAITFDDAYRGAVALGVPEVVRAGMPATIFVAPGMLGAGPPWWDRLAVMTDWTAQTRERAISECRGDLDLIRATFGLDRRAVALPEALHIATELELMAAASDPAVALGSHTWSHRNVTTLDAGELQAEYARPLEWLRERFETIAPWIAYPYGRYSPAAAAAAAAAGYTIGLRVDGGWLPARIADKLALPRFNVPAGISAAGFELRIRGIVAA